MITALVVDDDIGFSKILLDAITEVSRQLHMNLEVHVENHPLHCLEAHQVYDIYFLDIEMPELSGIDLVKRLREKYVNKEFVFVSAHDDYMRSSMFVKPRAFVRKDHLMADLTETLHVLNEVFRKCDAEITVKDNLRDIRIKPSQIAYMKSEEHYVRICAASGEDLLIRNKLRMLETRMKDYDFLRIHLRYLVNLNYVQDYYKYKQMVLKSGEELPISAPYAKHVNEIFMNWVMAGER